jgi:uncharacterized protein (TIGR03790 family)
MIPGMNRVTRLPAFTLTATMLLASAVPAAAQSPENVAVVVNDASPASQQIAEYYVRKRAIPASNVIHITAPTTEEISRQVFAAAIEAPIAAALGKESLQDRVLYLVLTKGIPLRVAGTVGLQGTVASVDSELTLLYRKMTGKPTTTNGRTDNPYFLAARNLLRAKPFSHADHDTYLVTRLDGFTVGDAIGLIDKAAAPSTLGKIVLDEKGSLINRSADNWLEEAASRLTDAGWSDRIVLDRAGRAVRGVESVLGYYSWGSNDPANAVRKFELTFVPGAIAGTFVSTDGRTFQEPPAAWLPKNDWNDRASYFAGSPQTLIGDLIREGVTGAAAHVAEPYLESTVRPQILFPAYTSGFNLAESFYLSMPHLGWQTIVIGDPLCRPFKGTVLTRGDIETAVDPATELPGHFSKRRLEIARARLGTANMDNVALAVKAETRFARGDRAGGRKALEEVTAADPLMAVAQFQLALMLEADGDRDGSIQRYRKVIAVQPNNAIALNNLAYSLAVHKKQPEEARPLAQRASMLAPREPTILDTFAWIEHLVGNHANAAKLIGAAVNGAPTNAEVRMHAAFIYAASGAPAAALAELNFAVKYDPALAARADVKQLRAQLEKR